LILPFSQTQGKALASILSNTTFQVHCKLVKFFFEDLQIKPFYENHLNILKECRPEKHPDIAEGTETTADKIASHLSQIIKTISG
jgi:hypothetical protein